MKASTSRSRFPASSRPSSSRLAAGIALHGAVGIQGAQPGRLALVAQERVRRDAVEPGAMVGITGQPVPGAIGLERGFLIEIVRVGSVARQMQGKAIDLRAVPRECLVECRAVPPVRAQPRALVSRRPLALPPSPPPPPVPPDHTRSRALIAGTAMSRGLHHVKRACCEGVCEITVRSESLTIPISHLADSPSPITLSPRHPVVVSAGAARALWSLGARAIADDVWIRRNEVTQHPHGAPIRIRHERHITAPSAAPALRAGGDPPGRGGRRFRRTCCRAWRAARPTPAR